MKRLLLSGTLGSLVLLTGMVGLQTRAVHATSFNPPPDNGLPRTSTGGASRGGFIPPADNSLPRTSTGGASRGTFTPSPDNAAPRRTSGGAARSGFNPPSENTAPRTAVGGAARTNLYGYLPSQSESQSLPMLAVTPQNFYGTTLAERPTILVYVPSSNAQDAVFSLKDDAGNTVYQTLVTIPNNAGVVAVQLPKEAPALEVGKEYQWFFALMIDGTLSPSTPYVDAWIKRVQPDAQLAQALQQSDVRQQADILAAKGVWYDSAALLTNLRMAQPTDVALAADWHELLNSVGLEAVTAAYPAPASTPVN